MRALAKNLRAGASNHSSNFCKQFEQRLYFVSTFKLDGTIRYPSRYQCKRSFLTKNNLIRQWIIERGIIYVTIFCNEVTIRWNKVTWNKVIGYRSYLCYTFSCENMQICFGCAMLVQDISWMHDEPTVTKMQKELLNNAKYKMLLVCFSCQSRLNLIPIEVHVFSRWRSSVQ